MKEIPEITGMRGYASLGVVFFHFSTLGLALSSIPLAPLINSWNSGVDFFYVLSGFLLSLPFLQPGSTTNLRNFYLKRIFRTFPVYYLNLLIIGAILITENRATLQQLLTGLVFAQSFSPSTFNSINGVNWSLVIEEIFYASLPVFSILFTGKRWKYSLPVCLGISVFYRWWAVDQYSNSNLTFHLWQYPSFLGHYALGLTLANFYVNRRFFSDKFRHSWPLPSAIAALLVTQYYVGSRYGFENNVQVLPGILFAFEYGLLIYSALNIPASSVFTHIFNNPIATLVGKISYSLYSWHLPIEIYLLRSGFSGAEWVALSLFLSFSVAILSYKFVEKPFLGLRDKLLGAKPKREVPLPVPRAGI